jgi:hypothetical protein
MKNKLMIVFRDRDRGKWVFWRADKNSRRRSRWMKSSAGGLEG